MSSNKTLSDKENENERLFNEAIQARDADELARAEDLFRQLLGVLTKSDRKLKVATNVQLGFVESQLKKFKMAEESYRQAIEGAPHYELASLGLFHSLVDQDKWTEALSEVVRFVALRDSEAYRELLGPGYEDDMSSQDQALVQRARSLLAGHEVVS